MTTTAPTIGTGLPVIMVDDSDVDFHIASLMYKRTGFTNALIHCASGAAVLDYLNAQPDPGAGSDTGTARAEVILMDLNMPGMNGIETVNAIRQQPQFVEVPIVAMLTSSSDPLDVDRATAAGANDYFEKPMDPNEYIAIFTKLAG